MEIIWKICILSGLLTISNAGKWGYPDLENEEEFSDWGGLCDVGKKQSPIDLSFTKSFKGIFRDYLFRNYDQPLQNPQIENNGHTVKIKFYSPTLSVLGGGLKGEYFLEEVHFHWSSEHTIEERRYPLEGHFVHRNGRYKNGSEALKHTDGFAVFGILFMVSSNDNEELAKILKSLDAISGSDQIGKSQKLSEKIILQNLLPKNPSRDYFFYRGSLTTPLCAESVTWTVYSEAKTISLEQLEKFAFLETEEGKKLKNNFRPIQKIRNRPVTYITKWDTPVKCSSAGILQFNFFNIIILSFIVLMYLSLKKSI